MSRIVYLARHGETEWNRLGRWQGHTDVPLSAIGRTQAAALAERMRGRDVGSIHASDLARAVETAEIIGQAIGLAVVARDAGLRERAFGRFEGLTREECAHRYPDDWIRYRADQSIVPPGGEPHDQVVLRMAAAVRRAAWAPMERAMAGAREQGATGAVLVISHGGSIRALLSSVTGTQLPPMPNAAVFRLMVAADGTLREVAYLEESAAPPT